MASDLLAILQDVCALSASHAAAADAGEPAEQSRALAMGARLGLEDLATAEMAFSAGAAADGFWVAASTAGVNAVEVAR